MEKIKLPTGYLLKTNTGKPMETLSIGDYGKSRNIKADFLGYSRELNGVPNGEIMPISEKWVMTLSTQHGCVQKCTFCDVPNIKFRGNVSVDDLTRQVKHARRCFPDVKYTDRLNIHFARMGEPILNEAVFDFTSSMLTSKRKFFQDDLGLRVETIHPVLTTMLPKAVSPDKLHEKLVRWVNIKNDLFRGQAGLQLSINSTDYEQREKMFDGCAMSLGEIAELVRNLPKPIGRKYCLNFAYANEYKISGSKLAELFDPESWMVKITPIHNNNATAKNGIKTVDGYHSYAPYRDVENSCKEYGFDVLVFVPSMDEENGLVTCGNAILGGSKLRLKASV